MATMQPFYRILYCNFYRVFFSVYSTITLTVLNYFNNLIYKFFFCTNQFLLFGKLSINSNVDKIPNISFAAFVANFMIMYQINSFEFTQYVFFAQKHNFLVTFIAQVGKNSALYKWVSSKSIRFTSTLLKIFHFFTVQKKWAVHVAIRT